MHYVHTHTSSLSLSLPFSLALSLLSPSHPLLISLLLLKLQSLFFFSKNLASSPLIILVDCLLQCVAVCYSVLQCVAVCRSVSQCVAARLSVLQCVSVCCSAVAVCRVRCSQSPRIMSSLLLLQCVAVLLQCCCSAVAVLLQCVSLIISSFQLVKGLESLFFFFFCLEYGVATNSRLLKIVGLFCRI